MDIPTQEQLLDRIEDFRTRHGMAETRFGRDAVNNPAFIRQLREGKSPTLDTLNKLKDFMADKDAAAALKAKLSAVPAPIAPEQPEMEEPLPFGKAPVSPTGDSSPTCSTTAGPPRLSGANGSSRCSTAERDARAPQRKPSCSEAD